MLRCLMVLLCLAPAWVIAGDDIDKASQMIDRMNFHRALKLARKVLSSPDVGPAELASAYHIEGLSLSALGRRKQAMTSFRKLLAIDPDFEVSRDVSPKLTQAFKQVQAGKMRPKPLLLIHIPPENVESLAGLALEVNLEADDLRMVHAIRLRYRSGEKPEQLMALPVKKPGPITIQLGRIEAEKLAYYFEALNRYKGVLARAGSQTSPFRLEVKRPVTALAPVTGPRPPPSTFAKAPTPVEDGFSDRVEPVTPWYETWWFWTAVGAVVVAGAATGTALALSGDGSGDTTRYEIRFR